MSKNNKENKMNSIQVMSIKKKYKWDKYKKKKNRNSLMILFQSLFKIDVTVSGSNKGSGFASFFAKCS